MKRVGIKSAIILLISIFVQGQDIDVETFFDDFQESKEFTDLVEYLETLTQHPLDLNQASVEQLSSLPWISTPAAVRIVEYRLKQGPFQNVQELGSISGLSVEMERIRPFITVKKRQRKVFLLQGRHRIINKTENARGYVEQKYAGSKSRFYNRFKGGNGSSVQFGALLEKDPGEQRIDDLAIGHVLWRPQKVGAQVLAGHFTGEFGQGLTLWGPYRLSKGSDPLAPAQQRGRGLVPALSTAENAALYGLALSEKMGQVELYAFSSRNTRDARLDSGVLLSTPVSGLHRTKSELAAENRAVERLYGGAGICRFGKAAQIGAVMITSQWNYPFRQQTGVDQYEFSGRFNRAASLFYDVAGANYRCFGEVARSSSGGWAATSGGVADFSDIRFIFLWRRYGRNFQNQHALAFGEKDDIRNESGFYFGLRWRVQRQTLVSFYSDFYRFPWPGSSLPMPGSGQEMMAMLEQKMSPFITLHLRLRSEVKTTATIDKDLFGNPKALVTNPRKTYARLQIDIQPTKRFRLRNRIELSFLRSGITADQDRTYGIMMYQDLSWMVLPGLRLQSRWTLFDTPSYDLRLYQFENDLPGVMRIKMLSGRGSRWYGVLTCKWKKKMQISLKFDRTSYDDRDALGSGMESIEGAQEHLLSLQLDWRL